MSANVVMDLYAVVGYPIAHSKSPFIHRQFAQQTGEALEYEAILIPPGRFIADVEAFRQRGGLGLNVTIPFKPEAFALATHLSERAARAEAVNTLWLDEQGHWCGDNTDGVGFIRDLVDNWGYELPGRRVLLVGAGGAAQGIVEPLLQADIAQLTIANRTAAKAHRLAAAFAGADIVGCGLDELTAAPYELIINATAASLDRTLPKLPPGITTAESCCYDLMYGVADTPFMVWAKAQGVAKVCDGLGMLVEQAAESFFRWRGCYPRTEPVIAALRAHLQSPAK